MAQQSNNRQRRRPRSCSDRRTRSTGLMLRYLCLLLLQVVWTNIPPFQQLWTLTSTTNRAVVLRGGATGTSTLFAEAAVTTRQYQEEESDKQRKNKRRSQPTGGHRRPSFDQQSKRWGIPNTDENHSTNVTNAFELNGTKALSLIFPTRQPRHVAEGAINLARSVFTGVGMGLLSVLAMPIAGFRQGGMTGIAAGSLAGILYGTVFAFLGVANGAYQMARGVLETPNAFRAVQEGKIWDTTAEEWRLYYLEDELDELSSVPYFLEENHSVKDMTYYNLLDVSPTASTQEIKRAYHRKAKDVHPDKNPGDIAAAHSFQQLHTAYVTLSDEESRAAYDTWGYSSAGTHRTDGDTAPVPLFDPYVFYAILFSSQTVEPYIGELTVASFTEQVMHLLRSGGRSPEDFMKLLWGQSDRRKRKRQSEIALYLKGRVSDYVQGTVSSTEFRMQCRREAAKIADTPFGQEYLSAIGSALVIESSRYLGFHRSAVGWVRGVAVVIQKNVGKVKSMISIIHETMDVLRLWYRTMYNEDGSPVSTPTPASMTADAEQLLPELLDVAWAYNFQDIGKTLHGACSRLFTDASANSQYKRLERAEAVQIIGEEFLRMAELRKRDSDSPANTGTNGSRTRPRPANLMARLEVAFQVSVMKATGQNTPEDSEALIRTHKRSTR